MELKVKLLKWSAGIPVAMLRKKTADKIGVHAQDRVFIRTDGKEFTTILDTVEAGLISEKDVAVSSEIQKIMDLRAGQRVDIGAFEFKDIAPPTNFRIIAE